MRVIEDIAEARTTVLRRVPWDWGRLPEAVRQRTARAFGRDASPEEVVEQVFQDVAARGDAAVLEYTARFDGVQLDSLEVPRERWEAALRSLSPSLREALQVAAQRITAFHAAQLPAAGERSPGAAAWLRWTPVDRAGLYVPGGAASYPSTLLMTAVPATVAGVREVLVATSPARLTDLVLAAAAIAGVHRLFQVGGIPAIAALAVGTETVPKVDVIAGPGNIFVQLAKRRAYGLVGIDGLYGPSETVVIADEQANPAWCAADLLAQAEHDPLATPLCFTPSRAFAEAVLRHLQEQLQRLPRRQEIEAALEGQGAIVVVRDIAEAIALANEFAPEHLCLAVQDPERWLPHVRHAGGIFLGEVTPESLGDYIIGPSHVMPTGGSARFSSVLNVFHFLKATAVFPSSPELVQTLGGPGQALAEAEGLAAHARAIGVRLEPQR